MPRQLSVVALLLALACSAAPGADLIVYGRVWTGDSARPWAGAVAVRGDTVAAVGGSTGNKVVAANVASTNGYLQAGDAYFQKFVGSSDSNYHLKVNELLTKLANPSASCTGLLQSAAVAAGGAIWTCCRWGR